MSPDELYTQARDVIDRCDATGVKVENAAAFIAQAEIHVRHIGSWLPPVYGTVGYADGQVIDQLRQLKFQSEGVLRNFPTGIEALTVALVQFCQYLRYQYAIRSEES